VAFDKHWNLALVDVDETWTRKRFPRTSNFDVDEAADKVSILLNSKKIPEANPMTFEFTATTPVL
jgi:small nuclear ribonucleoprotein (snRNP)-like protein